MRWFRASRLWRDIFRRWTARAREQLRLRRDAAAVVAMEERRKRYQADAQQRLAWVDEGLAQQGIVDSTCTVCSADAGQSVGVLFDAATAPKCCYSCTVDKTCVVTCLKKASLGLSLPQSAGSHNGSQVNVLQSMSSPANRRMLVCSH